jgi:hypothetical protein
MWALSSHLVSIIYALLIQASAALQNGRIHTSSWESTGAPKNTFATASKCQIFKTYPTINSESVCWAFENNLDSKHALTHSLFREVASHLRSNTASNGSRVTCLPFLIQRNIDDCNEPIVEFSCEDLKYALASDYLDACTGKNIRDGVAASASNDGEGGWRMEGLGSINTPSTQTGASTTNMHSNQHSFQSKRLHWDSVVDAKNTVVFNSAGAHISSQLAPTSLAALHGLNGAATGICLNLYVTKSDLLQSAPPHTDKQDVVVIQTQGRKRWRVYSPSDSAMKFHVDPFCRGKGDDELSVEMLSDEGSELLLDVTLLPGDVLFVPARFPHTTDTLDCYGEEDEESYYSAQDSGDGDYSYKKRPSSIHLTLGLDTHVWAMNYVSMRKLALRRFGVHDALVESNDFEADQQSSENMEQCVGRVNQLSYDLREGLFSSLDFNNTCYDSETSMAKNLLAFHDRINLECSVCDSDKKQQIHNHNSLTLDQCLSTVHHFQNVWQKIEIMHQKMYIAALMEERVRITEKGGWATNVGDFMVQKRAERLSIFRVFAFFEKLDKLREMLRAWGDGDPQGNTNARHIGESLPNLMEGDQVEANLLDARGRANTRTSALLGTTCYDRAAEKGSWSSAKVIKVRADGLFNLQLFDGTIENDIHRVDIKGPHGLGIFI